jgi:FtsH-binding integral membrane protein
MNVKALIASATLALSALAVPAFAASTRTDHSGFVVWIFLGFCGLIVAAQLIPALLVMFGMAKAVVEPKQEEAKQSAN